MSGGDECCCENCAGTLNPIFVEEKASMAFEMHRQFQLKRASKKMHDAVVDAEKIANETSTITTRGSGFWLFLRSCPLSVEDCAGKTHHRFD